MKIKILLISLLLLGGCAWWQAGINDPEIVQAAIKKVEPYKELASAVYPHAGKGIMLGLVPLLILLMGRKKLKEGNATQE